MCDEKDESTSVPPAAQPQVLPASPPHYQGQTLHQISLKLIKLNVKPGNRVEITQDILDSIRSSSYSEQTWQAIEVTKATAVQPLNIVKEDSDSVPYLIVMKLYCTGLNKHPNQEK